CAAVPIRSAPEIACDSWVTARRRRERSRSSTSRVAAWRAPRSSPTAATGKRRSRETRPGPGQPGSISLAGPRARYACASWCCADARVMVSRDLAWLAAAPLLLGGLLPLDDGAARHWCVAGRWVLPVGDPSALGRPGPHGERPDL